MTIEALLDCDATTLAKMTDAELLEHFKIYLDVTRPERAATAPQATKERNILVSNPKLAEAKRVAEQLGIKIDIGLLTAGRKVKR